MAVDKGHGDDARDAVGVIAVSTGDDLGHEMSARVEPDARLRLVVDLPFPAVDRPDWRDAVAARDEAGFDQVPGEVDQPVGVVGGDDDFDARRRLRGWVR